MENETFYEQQEHTIQQTTRGDMLILMEDINAKTGRNNTNLEKIMGQHGLGEMNETGELFTPFCFILDLFIGGTFPLCKKP